MAARRPERCVVLRVAPRAEAAGARDAAVEPERRWPETAGADRSVSGPDEAAAAALPESRLAWPPAVAPASPEPRARPAKKARPLAARAVEVRRRAASDGRRLRARPATMPGAGGWAAARAAERAPRRRLHLPEARPPEKSGSCQEECERPAWPAPAQPERPELPERPVLPARLRRLPRPLFHAVRRTRLNAGGSHRPRRRQSSWNASSSR